MLCLPCWSLPFSIRLSLTFNVFFDTSLGTACCKHKTLAPEMFFPQLLPYLRKFFLQKSAACTFICIYELTYFCIWVCPEKYIVHDLYRDSIPQDDIVFGAIYSNISFALSEIHHQNLPAVLNHKHKMIVQQNTECALLSNSLYFSLSSFIRLILMYLYHDLNPLSRR